MKRKHEMHQETMEQRGKPGDCSEQEAADVRTSHSSYKRFNRARKQSFLQQLQKKTHQICKDITRWLQANKANFIEDF